MSMAQTTRPSAPIGAILVLMLAAILYAGMMANIEEIQNANSDAMGRGLASAFALFFGIAEWIMLGILLLIAGVKGDMPNWSAIAAAILAPLSCIAAVLAMNLLDAGATPRWQLVPALLPPLIAAYALWARLPALHRTLRPLPISLAAWGAIALLSLAPLPQYLAR